MKAGWTMASDELRVTMARVLAGYDSLDFDELPEDESPNYAISDQRGYLMITDDLIDEIDRAGYVVVDREMWERMTALSNAAYRFALGSEVNDDE